MVWSHCSYLDGWDSVKSSLSCSLFPMLRILFLVESGMFFFSNLLSKSCLPLVEVRSFSSGDWAMGAKRTLEPPEVKGAGAFGNCESFSFLCRLITWEARSLFWEFQLAKLLGGVITILPRSIDLVLILSPWAKVVPYPDTFLPPWYNLLYPPNDPSTFLLAWCFAVYGPEGMSN